MTNSVDKLVREAAGRATGVFVGGRAVDPWKIVSQLEAHPARAAEYAELHLGLAILIFELQQCDVRVDRANILEFVLDDLKRHRGGALDGYLTIARHVVSPPPRRPSLGW